MSYTFNATVRSSTPPPSVILKAPNSVTSAPREPPSFDIASEECVLRDIVDKVLAQGEWITRTPRCLCGQELVVARASIRLAVTAALLRKESECAAGIIKAVFTKVLAKQK